AGAPCGLVGGLGSEHHGAEAVGGGVARVIVGTRALKDPQGFEALCRRFPGRVVLGIDARDGRVATDGWLQVSDCSALDLARQCAGWPLAALIYTDISRDGMLQGPNVEAVAPPARPVELPVIASGGRPPP